MDSRGWGSRKNDRPPRLGGWGMFLFVFFWGGGGRLLVDSRGWGSRKNDRPPRLGGWGMFSFVCFFLGGGVSFCTASNAETLTLVCEIVVLLRFI